MGAYKTGEEIPEKMRRLFEDSMEQELEGIIKLEKTEQGYYRYLCIFKEVVRIADVEALPKDNLVRIRYSSMLEAIEL